MREENRVISVLYVMGCILVVVGHSLVGINRYNIIVDWIYSFHMPLFMFIAGYLLKYTNRQLDSIEPIPFLSRKAKRLLLPYFIISSCVYLPKVALSQFAIRPIELSAESYFNMLLYPWQNVIVTFWFLPTLFLLYAFALFGNYMCNAVRMKDTLSPLLVLIIFAILNLLNPLSEIGFLNLGGVLGYSFYFVLGYVFCRNNYERYLRFPALTAVVTFVLSIFLMQYSEFGWYRLISAINGILMCYAMACIYRDKNWNFFNPFFGATFAIYLLSWFPQVLCRQLFMQEPDLSWSIGCMLSIVSGFYVPYWIWRWIVANRERKLTSLISFITGI